MWVLICVTKMTTSQLSSVIEVPDYISIPYQYFKQVRSIEAVASLMYTQLQIHRYNELMLFELNEASLDEVKEITQRMITSSQSQGADPISTEILVMM